MKTGNIFVKNDTLRKLINFVKNLEEYLLIGHDSECFSDRTARVFFSGKPLALQIFHKLKGLAHDSTEDTSIVKPGASQPGGCGGMSHPPNSISIGNFR